jgi:hypothetical protein
MISSWKRERLLLSSSSRGSPERNPSEQCRPAFSADSGSNHFAKVSELEELSHPSEPRPGDENPKGNTEENDRHQEMQHSSILTNNTSKPL